MKKKHVFIGAAVLNRFKTKFVFEVKTAVFPQQPASASVAFHAGC